jgi:hypothetical protein
VTGTVTITDRHSIRIHTVNYTTQSVLALSPNHSTNSMMQLPLFSKTTKTVFHKIMKVTVLLPAFLAGSVLARTEKYRIQNKVAHLSPGVPTSMTRHHASRALPVVSSKEDRESLNRVLLKASLDPIEFPQISDDTTSRIRETDYARRIGLPSPEAVVKSIEVLLVAHEVPEGLTSKLLELGEFEELRTCYNSHNIQTLSLTIVEA